MRKRLIEGSQVNVVSSLFKNQRYLTRIEGADPPRLKKEYSVEGEPTIPAPSRPAAYRTQLSLLISAFLSNKALNAWCS